MKLYSLWVYSIHFKSLIDLNLALSGQKARVQAITTSKQQRSVVIQLGLSPSSALAGKNRPPQGAK